MLKIRTKISRLPVIIFVILLAAFFYGLIAKPVGRLSWHQQILFALLTPMQKTVNFIGSGITGVWDHYFNLVNVSKENNKLKKILDEQAFKINKLVEVENENNRLRELMRFKDRYEIDAVGAEVVANDPRGDFRSITIDKGEADGIKANQPVISAFGLVGRTVDVSKNVSRVLLITDPNSAVDVLVQRTRARALLVGAKVRTSLDSSYYLSKLEYLNRKSDIMNGDLILTSGFDGVYPAGIPVGVVANMEYAPQGVFRDAVVMPFADFSNLEEVLIVVR